MSSKADLPRPEDTGPESTPQSGARMHIKINAAWPLIGACAVNVLASLSGRIVGTALFAVLWGMMALVILLVGWRRRELRTRVLVASAACVGAAALLPYVVLFRADGLERHWPLLITVPCFVFGLVVFLMSLAGTSKGHSRPPTLR